MSAPERVALGTRLARAPATVGLFAICVAVFVLAERDGDTTKTDTLLAWGAAWRGQVWLGEWWRLISACFLHIGVGHLAWNLIAGFGWAEQAERRLGRARFLALYLVSGMVGAAASVLGHSVVSAGASGALFGCTGAQLAFDRADRGSWAEVIDHRVKDLMMIVVWFGFGAVGNFDNFAHAGGLLVGLSMGWWFVTPSRRALALAAAPLALIPISIAPAFTTNEFNRPDRIFEAEVNGRWKEALRLIDEQTASTGSTPYLLAARASALEGLSDDEALSALLANALASEWSTDLRVTQARMLSRRGDRDAGLTVLDQAIVDDPQHLNSRIEHAWAWLGRDTERTAADVDVIARLAPAADDVPLLRGWLALNADLLDEARDQLQRARPSNRRDDLAAAIDEIARLEPGLRTAHEGVRRVKLGLDGGPVLDPLE